MVHFPHTEHQHAATTGTGATAETSRSGCGHEKSVMMIDQGGRNFPIGPISLDASPRTPDVPGATAIPASNLRNRKLSCVRVREGVDQREDGASAASAR